MRQGVVYAITGLECEGKEIPEIVQYVGETGRTMYDRGLEHFKAHRARNPDSVLIEHEAEAHDGKQVNWAMEPLTWTKSNLVRQATEAYKIENSTGTTLINRRGEWRNNLPPRLTLCTGEGRDGHQEQP